MTDLHTYINELELPLFEQIGYIRLTKEVGKYHFPIVETALIIQNQLKEMLKTPKE